eukprot:Skav201722  [mRNA]  locus=scaffold311:524623:529676:- [translate_table: standard]
MSEGSIQWANVSHLGPPAYPLEPSDLELGSPSQVPWSEKIKHQILLFKLQRRPYFIYCLLCSLVAATAFLSTLLDLCFASEKGWHDILEGGTWQSSCWSAVREEAEEADLWLIFLRFALQPCRVFASAANARKVQQMQKGCVPWCSEYQALSH